MLLASASPRRRDLLARLGLPFRTAVSAIEETPLPGESGEALARRLARTKALVIAPAYPDVVVLAADTVVVLDGCPLGKPADTTEAWTMLRALRGRSHEVITAVCVYVPGRSPLSAALTTCVWMRAYGDDEIAAYVASGEPFDKAGAYAIQDPTFRPVARWRGCYTNVVGLPLCLTSALLQTVGVVPTGSVLAEAP